jgi:hypothetical protein
MSEQLPEDGLVRLKHAAVKCDFNGMHTIRLIIIDICDVLHTNEIISQGFCLHRYQMEAQAQHLMQSLQLRAFRRMDRLRSQLTRSKY